ncbi:MAG: hypothetical protein JRN67_12840 [Nitrososphaerota archaeon]|nr:hypothetical protein [Nitrososphaerota archaeon]
MNEEKRAPAAEILFPIVYYSTASNLLLGIIIVMYVPLIVSPLVLIQFTIETAGIMSILLLALAFGIYVFKGNPSKKKGTLLISPGDTRIEGKNSPAFVVSSQGLTQIEATALKSTQASLFETRILFESAEDCRKAHEFIKQYY